MSQTLQDVVASIVEFGAVESSGEASFPTLVATRNAAAIQNAIGTGKQVLFPKGTWPFSGVIWFLNDDQACDFLAGAVLQPVDDSSYVRITGRRQSFDGLRIEPASGITPHNPLVDIDDADELVLDELRVTLHAPPEVPEVPTRALVRVQDTVGCRLIGGRISGVAGTGRVGLWITAGGSDRAPRDVTATGLWIRNLDWAVRIDGSPTGVTLLSCALLNNPRGAVFLTSEGDSPNVVSGFRLIDSRMAKGNPEQYVWIGGETTCKGAVITGCTFDTAAGADDEDDAEDSATAARSTARGGVVPALRSRMVVPTRSTAVVPAQSRRSAAVSTSAPSTPPGASGTLRSSAGPTKPGAVGGRNSGALASRVVRVPGASGATGAEQSRVDACILRVDGRIDGLLVGGCSSERVTTRDVVWGIASWAELTNTFDVANAWAQTELAGGAGADQLVWLGSDGAGNLTIGADRVQFTADAMSFSGEYGDTPTPVAPATTYSVAPSRHAGDRTLSSANASLVLAQLLLDLAALGIVSVR